MKYRNILIVEDEKNISQVIKAYLEKDGFLCFIAEDGEVAIEIFEREEIHLVVLDLMLPKLSGEEIAARIRNKSQVPIIILTAKTDEESKLEGFSLGADEYVSKPFSPKVLVKRVKALLRRSYRDEDNSILADKVLINNDLEINFDNFTVKKQGNLLDLTINEFKILKVMVSNPKMVLSREKLIQLAFGYDYDGYDRTIDTYIKNIRQKIEDNPRKPKYIETVYGLGYRFNNEVEA